MKLTERGRALRDLALTSLGLAVAFGALVLAYYLLSLAFGVADVDGG